MFLIRSFFQGMLQALQSWTGAQRSWQSEADILSPQRTKGCPVACRPGAGMIRNTVIGACIMVVLGLACPGQATSAVWEFDKAHSNIHFAIRHIFSKTFGSFEDFSGEFRFDPQHPEKGSFAFTVQTQSIDTRVPKRDNHLRSEDFFDVAEYPVMTFTSTSIRQLDTNRLEVEGRLRIKDVSRTITVPVTFFGVKDHPLNQGQRVAGFETTFSLDRLDYGVGSGKFYNLGAVGKTVDVTVSLEMLRKE